MTIGSRDRAGALGDPASRVAGIGWAQPARQRQVGGDCHSPGYSGSPALLMTLLKLTHCYHVTYGHDNRKMTTRITARNTRTFRWLSSKVRESRYSVHWSPAIVLRHRRHCCSSVGPRAQRLVSLQAFPYPSGKWHTTQRPGGALGLGGARSSWICASYDGMCKPPRT
jgi:hypothetical protein